MNKSVVIQLVFVLACRYAATHSRSSQARADATRAASSGAGQGQSTTGVATQHIPGVEAPHERSANLQLPCQTPGSEHGAAGVPTGDPARHDVRHPLHASSGGKRGHTRQ